MNININILNISKCVLAFTRTKTLHAGAYSEMDDSKLTCERAIKKKWMNFSASIEFTFNHGMSQGRKKNINNFIRVI